MLQKFLKKKGLKDNDSSRARFYINQREQAKTAKAEQKKQFEDSQQIVQDIYGENNIKDRTNAYIEGNQKEYEAYLKQNHEFDNMVSRAKFFKQESDARGGRNSDKFKAHERSSQKNSTKKAEAYVEQNKQQYAEFRKGKGKDTTAMKKEFYKNSLRASDDPDKK